MSAARIYHESLVVGPESIDIQGHVNNREYLRWMEHAATLHAAEIGWGIEALKAAGRAWVAREHWIEYLRPSFEGEALDVYSWIQSAHGAASLRRYAVKRGETLLAVGATEWVYIDAERGRPVLLPEADLKNVALVRPDDPELAALGIARPIRFSPGPHLLGLTED